MIQLPIPRIVSLALCLTVLAGCASSSSNQQSRQSPTPAPSSSPDKQIKLDTFNLPSPSAGGACSSEGVHNNCDCPPPRELCTKDDSCSINQACGAINWQGVANYTPPGGGAGSANCPAIKQLLEDGLEHCLGKPVIYLYPEKETFVDVVLHTPGFIYISDPLYPTGGWHHVLAQPDGTLSFQGKTYHELYYESAVGDVKAPTTGMIIPKALLSTIIPVNLKQLGLNDREITEFMAYWLPQLIKLDGQYIQFSLIDQHEKQRIDEVAITPKPDTFIEILVYFKPLTDIPPMAPLEFPDSPPKRVGFTAVEWGGTIAGKSVQ